MCALALDRENMLHLQVGEQEFGAGALNIGEYL